MMIDKLITNAKIYSKCSYLSKKNYKDLFYIKNADKIVMKVLLYIKNLDNYLKIIMKVLLYKNIYVIIYNIQRQ